MEETSALVVCTWLTPPSTITVSLTDPSSNAIGGTAASRATSTFWPSTVTLRKPRDFDGVEARNQRGSREHARRIGPDFRSQPGSFAPYDDMRGRNGSASRVQNGSDKPTGTGLARIPAARPEEPQQERSIESCAPPKPPSQSYDERASPVVRKLLPIPGLANRLRGIRGCGDAKPPHPSCAYNR